MLKQIGILIAILFFINCKVPKGMINAPPPKQKGSHFYSDTDKTKEFALTDLDTSKVLVLILKPKAQIKDIDIVLENQLKFEVKYKGDVKQTCQIKNLNSLCVIPKVNGTNDNSLKVTCSKLPCQFTFDAVQLPEPKPSTELKNDSLQYLYKINANESLIKVKSNDPSIDDMASKVRVYVNAPFELINKENNLLYYDFDEYIDYVLVYPTPQIEKSVRVNVELTPEDDIGFNTTYRFTVNKTREIKINKIPSKQLRVDMTLSQVNDKALSKLNISFIGYKTSSTSDPVQIQTFPIDEMEQGGLLDLNLILKNNAFTSLSHFTMKISSLQTLLVSFQLDDVNIHELEVQQESYISLDKDQSVQYKVVASSDSSSTQVVSVQLLEQQMKDKIQITVTPTPCLYGKGCTLKVKAKEAVVMGLGVVLERQTKNDLKYITIKNSVQLLMAQGESLHLIYNQTSTKSKKVTVNSANVLVYVAGQKCPFPSQKCNQYSGSQQKPILIQNPSYPMYITTTALQLGRFTIRVDETDSVLELQNGVPLTQSISNNDGLYFKFKITQKEDVNFNLIAPLNAFKMYISNSNQKPEISDVNLEVSSNFVKFERNDIDELEFTILIKKTDNSSQDTFTIIASTKNSIIVLGKGQPHYDVLESEQTRHYVVIIQQEDMLDDVDTHVSFSIFQKVDSVNFTYSVGPTPDNNNRQQGKINRRHDMLDMEEYADNICTFKEEKFCQLFFSITNHNSDRLDVTLTLLTNNSVIQLKPGVWQSFEMASLTASNHFYFIPTNKKFPINLQFSHTFGSFKISYLLWKNQNQVTDAGAWPFPAESSAVSAKAAFQTSDFVIHTDQITKCFPNCILLISLVDTEKQDLKQKDPNIVAPIFSRFGSYSIMASNAIMQLRQLQKMSITLAKSQSKYVTIDLSPYLKNGSNVITIYSSSIVGFNTMVAKLSSNRNLEYPTDNDNDYRITGPEMQITLDDIRQKLEKNGMDEHEEIELIILFKALIHSRTVISFTSKQNYIEKLDINVPQDVHLTAGKSKYYSLEYYQDFKIKVVRVSGFPNFAWHVCPTSKIQQCIEQFEKNPGSVINSKADKVSIKHTQGTVVFVKFVAKDDPIQVQITAVGGTNAATQLKEGMTINDFLEKKDTNRYKISVVKQTETIITVTVFEGSPTVTVLNDFENIKITGKKKGNIIQIHVPSSAFKKALTNSTDNTTKSANQTALVSNTGLSSIFSELIIQVTDSQYNCPYSISYTLGKRNLFIQDGTLTSGSLRGGEEILYSYHNSKNSTAFVAISFDSAASLQKCEVQYASYTQNDDQQPVLQTPPKLEVKSRTPKPSISFQLDQTFSDFEIKLKNKDSKDLQFNITINHVDIVLLPYGYKYPNYIGKNQSAYFVIEVFNQGYIQFDIKKCTQNPLTFSYALDDSAFEDQTFTFTSEIEDYRFSSFVHVKASTIFLKIYSEQVALFSIEANWYKDKKSIPNNKIKAGDNGALEYVINDKMMATISFAPLNCEQCNQKNIVYEYVIGTSRSDVLAQSACEGSYFFFAPIQVYQSQTAKTRQSKVESGKLNFDIKLPGQLVYLGFKAKLNDGRQVFYSILQLSTVWGSIQKNKNYHLGFLTFLFFMVVFCCYMYRRRPKAKRSGKGTPYTDLPQEFDP